MIGLMLGASLFASPCHAQDAQAVYKNALPSVMTLNVVKKDGSHVTGTAFLAVKESFAVTAWHVVEDAETVTAKFSDGQEYDVSGLIDRDEKRDVALIRVKVSGRPMLTLEGNDPAVGVASYVLGAPKGLEFSLSDGIVSQVRMVEGVKVVQYTAPTNPGNSGGPLLNAKSEVLGVVSYKLRSTENLNFAISSICVKGLDDTLPTQPWSAVKKSKASAKATASAQEVNDEVKSAMKTLWNFAVRLHIEAESLFSIEFRPVTPDFIEDSVRVATEVEKLRAMELTPVQKDIVSVLDLAVTTATCLQECSKNRDSVTYFQDANARFVASYRFTNFTEDTIKLLNAPENQALRDTLGPALMTKISAKANQLGWVPADVSKMSRQRFDGGYRLLAKLALDVDSTGYVFGFVVDPSNPARVWDVHRMSPPGNWGFKRGDVVIEFDDVAVASIEEMKKAILATPKKEGFVTVMRDGYKRKLKVRANSMVK